MQEVQTASRMLVRFKDKILPIPYTDIALFFLDHELLKLVTFQGKTYFIHRNLEQLEEQFGAVFFRVNRQFLVSKTAILDLTACGPRTITVNLTFPFPCTITVSKEKSGPFLHWLAGPAQRQA
jgi:two-component system response regulator LytT